METDNDMKNLLHELVKQNIMLGQRLDTTNQRLDAANQRIDFTMQQILEQNKEHSSEMRRLQKDFAEKHDNAVQLFYEVREALKRLPDVVKQQIGFMNS